MEDTTEGNHNTAEPTPSASANYSFSSQKGALRFNNTGLRLTQLISSQALRKFQLPEAKLCKEGHSVFQPRKET